MAEKLWDGRFNQPTDKLVEKFTSSIEFDKKLYFYDIQGSRAHALMLAKAEIITNEDANAILSGLETIRTEIEEGRFGYYDSLEDIHMHIESRLFELIGEPAKKLHTARSRNDQVALDIRLYLRCEIKNIMALLKELRKVIVSLARKHIDIIMPGYTHLQRAQPVLLSHHLMAYYEMFTRDYERFSDCLKRTEVMPLGAAAISGTTYPIERDYTAKLLEFSEISKNSMDTVADRDFIIEFLSCASIAMIHFSRLSEELILWSTSEFSFVEISDAFTTGSSIMPQKKNPDVCELVRGKTGRVFGDLMAILTIMKSLPLAYNRDMQEDKEPIFDGVDTLKSVIEIYTRMLPEIKFRKDVMETATSQGFLNATDLADYLVTKGMAFRKAHNVVGKAVAYAGQKKKELHELDISELQSFSELIEKDIFDFLDTKNMVDRRNILGGTATKMVKSAISEAKKQLENQ